MKSISKNPPSSIWRPRGQNATLTPAAFSRSKEAARYVGLSVSTFAALVGEGRILRRFIEAKREPGSKRYGRPYGRLYLRCDLDRFLNDLPIDLMAVKLPEVADDEGCEIRICS